MTDIMDKPVKVLIVDDSAVMRQLLSDLLSTPEITVVGTATRSRPVCANWRNAV